MGLESTSERNGGSKGKWREKEIGQVTGSRVKHGSVNSCWEICKADVNMIKHLLFFKKGKNMLICLYDLQTYKRFWGLRKIAFQCAFKAGGWDCLWWSSGWVSALPMWRPWVRSLVGELGSHMPCRVAKILKKERKKERKLGGTVTRATWVTWNFFFPDFNFNQTCEIFLVY